MSIRTTSFVSTFKAIPRSHLREVFHARKFAGGSFLLVFAIQALLLSSRFALADTAETTWNGSSVTWSGATSWTPNGVPGTGTSAVFNSSFANQPTLTANQTTQGIWVTGSTATTGASGLTTIGTTSSGTLTIGSTAVMDGVTASILLDGAGNNSLTINTAVAASADTFLVNNAGTLTLNGTLNATGTITLGGSGNSGTFNIANTSAGGALDITTAGTVNLTGSIGGFSTTGIAITGGTTNVIGSGSIVSTKGVTVSNSAATLNLNTANALTTTLAVSAGNVTENTTNALAGNVLNISGSGTVNLSQANSLSGTTTLSGGSLILGNNGALGTSILVVSGGSLISASAPLSGVVNAFTIGTSSGTIAGSNNITFSGNVTNSAANRTLTVNNSATTSFTGGNIFLSETSATGRTLTITGSGNVVIGDVISNYNGAGGTAGSLTYNGSGVLTLGNANTYTGLTTMNAAAGTLILSGSNSGGGGVTLTTGTLDINNANALGTGTFTITAGTIDATNGPITNAVANAISFATLNFGGSNNLNLGTGAITQSLTRTVTLNGSGSILTLGGTYTNNNDAADTLTVNGTGNTLVLGSLALDGTGTTARVQTLAGSGNLTITGAVVNGASSGTQSLTITDTGTTTLSGGYSYNGLTTMNAPGGTLILAGNNTGTGGITMSSPGGDLVISGSNSGTGALTVSSGTVRLNITPATPNVLASATPVTLGNSTLIVSGSASSATAVTQNIGTFTLTANSSSGIILTDAGSATGSSLTTGTFTVPAANTFLYLNLSNAGTGALTLGTTAATALTPWAIVTNASNTVGFGQINSSHQLVLASVSDLFNNSNSSSTDYYTDSLADTAGGQYSGGTLTMNVGSKTLDSLFILANATGALNLSGTLGLTTGALGVSGASNYTITNGQLGAGNTLLTVNSVASGTLNINSQISTGTGSFTEAGTGFVVLGTTNAYTGLTTVAGGTLQLAVANAINSGNALTTNVGGTVDLAGNSESLGAVNNSGTITNSGAATTLIIGGGGTSGGLFSGSMTITVAGNTLNLNDNANTFSNLIVNGGTAGATTSAAGSGAYTSPTNLGTPFGTGTITLNGGTLVLGLNVSSGDTNGYTALNNNITLTGSGGISVGGQKRDGVLTGLISGSGQLTLNGSVQQNGPFASIYLTNADNTYTGGTNLNFTDSNFTSSFGFVAAAVNALGGGTGTGGVVTFVNNANAVITTPKSFLVLMANQSIAGLNSSTASSNGLGPDFVTGFSATTAPTLTISNTSGGTGDGSNYSGAIGGTPPALSGITNSSAAGNNINIVKAGTGSQIFSGTNTYTGTTTINGGKLVINGNNSAATGNVLVNGGGTLSGTGSIGGAVTLAGGTTLSTQGTINLQDGVIGTLTLGNGLTIGSGGNTSNLMFDLSGGLSDELAVTAGSIITTGTAVIGVDGLSALTLTSGSANYTLITGAGGLGTGNFVLSGTTLTVGASSYNLSLANSTGTQEILTVTSSGSVAAPGTAYWQGLLSGTWATVTSGSTNFVTSASGTANTFALPGAATNVKFTANSASNLTTVLGQNFTINSLEFTGSSSTAATTSVTISGSTLTINASGTNGNTAGSGIVVDAGSATHTINSNVALGSSQTWTVNGITLTVSGNITDSGSSYSLTKSGMGTLVLSGSETYTGATLVGSGTLEVDGSLSGSTAVTVDVATLSGTGNIGGSVALTGTSNLSSAGTLTVASLTVNNGGNTISSGTVNATGGTTLNTNSGLAVNGTLEGTVAIGNGATLSGTGTVTAGVTVGAGGVTSPGGTAPGVMTTDLAYNGGSKANFNVAASGSGAPQGHLSGLYYSQVIVTGGSGTVSLGIGTGVTLGANSATSVAQTASQIVSGTSTSGVTLKVSLTSADYSTLVDNASTNYEAKAGNTGLDNYFVFNLGSTLATGRFTSLEVDVTGGADLTGIIYYSGSNDRFAADGVGNTVGDVYIGGQEYALAYTGNFGTNSTIGGNDIVLTAIPEPGTWGMIFGGFRMLTGIQRLRKRRVGDLS